MGSKKRFTLIVDSVKELPWLLALTDITGGKVLGVRLIGQEYKPVPARSARLRAGIFFMRYALPVRTLFLDLASHDGLIACVGKDAVLAFRGADHRLRDHEFVPLVQTAMHEAGWTGMGLLGLACCVGPGGFTSLRVAVSCANAWWEAWGVALAGIHLSDLWKARTDEENVIWLHSTKKQEVFARGFGAYEALWPIAQHLSLEVLLSALPDNAKIIGELLPEHRALVEEKGAKSIALKELSQILPAFVGGLSFAHEPLEPWYGRKG